MKTGEYQWSGNYVDCIELLQAHIDCVPSSGPADDAIDYLRVQPQIEEQLNSLNTETVRRELRQYGAWSDAELSDDDANLARILWLAVCGCKETPEAYEVEA